MIKISIVIINWNGKKWLEKCLRSLSVQTYKDFEIIFVDNASEDDSLKFVERNYPNVVIIKSEKNLGFAGGNNLGFKYAKGEYILLLNNDTWVEKTFLNKMILFYESHAYDIIAPLELGYDKKSVKKEYFLTIDIFGHPFLLEKKMKIQDPFYLSGVCLFFSKKLYKNSQGLDKDFFMYFEETDWFWRLNLMKKKIFQMTDVFVYHAGAGSTGLGIKYKSFLWRNQNALQMLIKNYAWYNLLWTLPIYIIQNILEIIAFLIVLKPRIAWSYIEGWWFNVRYLPRTLEKRRIVQRERLVGDSYILKKMHKGFGKVYHLIRFM